MTLILNNQMEKLIQRQNITSEYQDFSAVSPKTPYKNSDEMDFNDVFGGPPRRFSMQEMRVRCSFSPETIESDHDERTPTLLSPWSKEKPVFGEEISNSSVVRRRQHHHLHQSDDFYGDIFRGDDSSYNSPRRSDLDRDNMFGSSPSGSRIMSPTRHSPSRNEPFSTSFPAQFSLPAKLTKAAEIPTFGSHNHSRNAANGLNSPHTSSTLSRFSNQANRNNPLSHQSSMSSEDFSPPHTDHHLGSETDGRNVDNNNAGNQFHFSIYKWAGQEVPMLIPLSSGRSQKDKSKFDSFSKSKLLSEANHQDEIVESFSVELDKKVFMSEEKINETEVLFKESHIEVAVTKLGKGSKDDSVNGEVEKNIKEEKEQEVKKLKESVAKQEAPLKSRGKSLRTFMTDEMDQPGKGAEMKENKVDTTSKGVESTDLNHKNTSKKTETNQKSEKVEKSVLQGEKKSGVKGKIRDFVQIFNQEADASLRSDASTRSKSYRWKPVSVQQKENEVTIKTPRTEVNMPKADEKLSSKNAEKKHNVTLKVEEKVEAKQYTDTKTTSFSSNLSTNNPKNEVSSGSNPSVEIFDDQLECNFVVQELCDDQQKNNITQNDETSEDIKALDAKIHQWSVGKKGNIRSLLSTLQYVLWQGSGWQPVPLVDLIEANSVKRAYQKALLRLHPDKLQQKGAATHHKYIAEKVFDILQEAWDHFNTLGL